jgi:hypothetical protein
MSLNKSLCSILPWAAFCGAVGISHIGLRAVNDAPPEANVRLVSFSYGGTGCAPGTLGIVLGTNNTISLRYDAFATQIGPGVNVTQNRKNCQININITSDPGWQMNVNNFGTTVRGYIGLDAGVNATYTAVYYFSGNEYVDVSKGYQCICTVQPYSAIQHFRTDFACQSVTDLVVGPVEASEYNKFLPQIYEGLYSPCGGGILNINNQMRLTSSDKNATGFFGPLGDDAYFSQDPTISWTKCLSSGQKDSRGN